jgi:Domain of Unknown Function (DUF928)
MRLVKWVNVFKSSLALCLGILVCGLPIAGLAIEFKPTRRGLPGRREGAGTRSPACVQDVRPLTALVPQTNLGLTVQEYPQFFWYVPKTQAKTLKFALFQGSEDEPERVLVYETTLPISSSGIVSFTLPKNADKGSYLALNKDYHWSVTLNCNAEDTVVNPQVEGWVQRISVSDSLSAKIAKAKPSDRPEIFAQHQLWFETVSSLASLRCANSTSSSVAASWKQLLKSVQLDKIADQPLRGKCPPLDQMVINRKSN